jgi:hypothetical protein
MDVTARQQMPSIKDAQYRCPGPIEGVRLLQWKIKN